MYKWVILPIEEKEIRFRVLFFCCLIPVLVESISRFYFMYPQNVLVQYFTHNSQKSNKKHTVFTFKRHSNVIIFPAISQLTKQIEETIILF